MGEVSGTPFPAGAAYPSKDVSVKPAYDGD